MRGRRQVKIGRMVRLALVLAALVIPVPVVAQEPAKPDDPVQLKGTIVKLQAAVLQRDREIARLSAEVAELRLAALDAAVKTMDPAVQKAAGVPPETTAKTAQAEKTPPKP